MALEFFADHCIPRSVVRAFEEKGFHVAILGDHLPTNAADEDVLAKAQELACVLITMDGDFAAFNVQGTTARRRRYRVCGASPRFL